MSQVEGLHHTLKQYIQQPTLGSFEVWKRMKVATDQQVHHIEIEDARSRESRPTPLLSNPSYFLQLNQVSTQVLNLVEEQRLLVTGIFSLLMNRFFDTR